MSLIAFNTMDEKIVVEEFYRQIANSHGFRMEITDVLRLGVSFNSEPDTIDQIVYHKLGEHCCNLTEMISCEVIIVPSQKIADVISGILLDPTNWQSLRTQIKMAEAMEGRI